MIEIKNLTKRFDNKEALSNVSATIQEGCIYGLIGANGAGKSTLLRLIAGVYKADSGEVLIDGEPVYENPKAKEKINFVADDIFFLAGTNLTRMSATYASLFKNFSKERFLELTSIFGLDLKAPISTFSKGMKRQAGIALNMSCMPKYIFFDETFDGLDPVVRNKVKSLFIADVLERKTTIILTSHSLRELEDTCDQLSLLHKGGIVFESDIQDLKSDMFKVQIGFDYDFTKELFASFEILDYVQHGHIASFILKGEKDILVEKLKELNPVMIETIPLSLEEIFIHKTSELGYMLDEVKNEK